MFDSADTRCASLSIRHKSLVVGVNRLPGSTYYFISM